MSLSEEREAQAHPAYDDALRQAARLAHADTAGRSFSVFWDGNAIFVREPGAEAPPNAGIICIAQRWTDKTVQLRFAGARSEWVKV